MIHFTIGTKAQLIKTAPVMNRLAERGMTYHYIDLGQHSKTTVRLRKVFNLGEPKVSLSLDDSRNVVSVKEAGKWALSISVFPPLLCFIQLFYCIQDQGKLNTECCK